MRSLKPSLIILALMMMSPVAMATPVWANSVNPNQISPAARSQWDMALQQWDVINYDDALRHLQHAAQIEGDSPELWIATADAATEVAGRHSRRDALEHLETAEHALSVLSSLPDIPQSIESRIPALENTVADFAQTVSGHLVRITNEPINLSSLNPGLISRTDHWRRRTGATGNSNNFYDTNPDWSNGNYNVLARRRADSTPAVSPNRPRSVRLNGFRQSTANFGGQAPRAVGFGVPNTAVPTIPRWNRGWSVRRPASDGSGL